MADRNLKKYLHDIYAGIDRINTFLGQGPREFEKFANNIMLRQAIERNLEIIGEAMNRILKINPDIAITNSRKVVVVKIEFFFHIEQRLS